MAKGSREGSGTELPGDGEVAVEALVRLHASDIAHNVSGAGIVGNLIAATATYIALLAVMINGTLVLPRPLAVFAPLPLLLILSYHLTLLAAIMKRSDSAKVLEEGLKGVAGLSAEEREATGTYQSDRVLDIRTLAESKEPWRLKVPKLALLFFPYVGWYAIGLALTAFVVEQSWLGWDQERAAGTATGPDLGVLIAATAIFALLWGLFITAALVYFILPKKEASLFREEDDSHQRPKRWLSRGRKSKGESRDPGPVLEIKEPKAGWSPGARIAAIIRLHESDIEGNVGAAGLSVTLIGTSAAYITILATSYRSDVSIPAWIYCLLALPVLLMQAYQMCLTAGVVRRARSAELLEDKLFSASGYDGVVDRHRIGTAQSDGVTDPVRIRRNRKSLREGRLSNASRVWVSQMSYAGWYATGLLLTGYTLVSAYFTYVWPAPDVYGGTGAFVTVGVAAVLYLIFWIAFGVTVATYFPRRSAGEAGRRTSRAKRDGGSRRKRKAARR